VSLAANDLDITVNSATDGAGLATSTASQVKTALEANAPINALVTVTLPGTGAAIISAQAQTALTSGARSLSMRIGSGSMSFTEHRSIEYVKDKGELYTTKRGDQDPVDLKFDGIIEYLSAVVASGNPTPREVLQHIGEASVWVSTGDDQCEPFSIDVEIERDDSCATEDSEFTTIEEFRWESGDFNLKDGMFSMTGKSNRALVTSERVA
jgi:hypothetical protein